MAILGLQGVRGGVGTTSLTAALGWARSLLDGQDWRDAGLRYTSQLDLLPFGQLTAQERENPQAWQETLGEIGSAIQALKASGRYSWILLDLPYGASPLTRQLVSLCDHTLAVARVDANCHIRLHQQALPAGAHILINDLRIGSQLQDDLYQVWLQSQRRLLPIVIHRDEAMAECMASKQPLGEYRSDSLAAEEVLTLANWCLLHDAGDKTSAGSLR
ncbi:cellulose synthase operon protein YhjQ [Salmonella enterica]|nr:cellulose synthase operon protein YhjQ [Salmonella enterica]